MAGPTHRAGSTRTHRSGVILAAITAVISGCAVFINAYGVRAWSGTADPTTYTTFKNLVAAIMLIGVGVALSRVRSGSGPTTPSTRFHWVGLGSVAVLGGAVAFALFFEGLARASSGQAAFIHKTLVIWVGILAVGLLRERLRPVHVAAVGLLVVGQFVLVGGVGDVTFGVGELMILAATLLWSVEVVLAKRLLSDLSSTTVGIARMAGGGAVLIVYGIVSGGFAAIGTVTPAQWGWVLVTGLVLSAYVGTWFAALERAPALDVTAILVGGAVVTAVLRVVFDGAAVPSPLGLGLVAAGSVLVIIAGVAMPRRRAAAEPVG